MITLVKCLPAAAVILAAFYLWSWVAGILQHALNNA